ncbi:potassium transporter TrkA [Natrinema sp. CBA1119]|uniref:ion channel n=1 Tax=Natrinema sp. CBA1119 TaxID=1608465 RepID=UPI000BF84C1D|nr:ion channel [Natrinema sp. CBA1119]PGF16813.1 potassium transporter TrkA [Natrinema sp. CBA1119]
MFEALHPRRPGGRVAVWIVAAIALTSIATGVGAILTRPALETGGTLGDLQAVAEFSGTIVGFALLVTAWGMRRGYRLAYVTAVLLVALSGAHGIVQFRAVSVPLVVLSVGGLTVLVATSGRFTRSSTLDATQIGAFLSIVGVLCYGTAGAYALRSGFDGVTTVVDAVYFTIVTASTVGYGDVHASTEAARLFAISLVVLGPATLAATVGSLFGPVLDTHLARTGREATARLGSDAAAAGGEPGTGAEIVVFGSDETIAPIVDALASRASVAVVTSDERSRRSDGVDVIIGDPTADGTLERAGLETCDAVLVGTAALRDADAVIAAARSHTDAKIVALTGGETESTDRTEADVVVDPETVLIEVTVDALLGTDGVVGQSSASAASHSG